MRVVMPRTIPTCPEHVNSGVSRYLLELTRGMAGVEDKEAVEFTGLPDHPDASKPSAIADDGESATDTPTIRRKPNRTGLGLALIIGTLREVAHLVRRYRRYTHRKCDIFHAQSAGCEVQTIAARLAGFKSIVTTVHTLPGENQAAQHWFRRLIEPMSFRCASHHICVSEATFDVWHERIGLKRKKCSVIYNGMTPPDYSEFDREAYRAKLGLTPDTVAIGICARLHYMKGHDILLKAFSIILREEGGKLKAEIEEPLPSENKTSYFTSQPCSKLQLSPFTPQPCSQLQLSPFTPQPCSNPQLSPFTPQPCSNPQLSAFTPHPSLRLLIAGTGPEEEKLKRLATELGLTDHVTFLGHVSDSPEFAKALDINVLPSTSETLGYSLVEAMFASVPSVVSNVGGMKELINASGGGRVVPANDTDKLADNLQYYINHPEIRQTDGNKAEYYAQQYLTAKTMAEKTAEVYRGQLCL